MPACSIPGCFVEVRSMAVDGFDGCRVIDAVLVWGDADDGSCMIQILSVYHAKSSIGILALLFV